MILNFFFFWISVVVFFVLFCFFVLLSQFHYLIKRLSSRAARPLNPGPHPDPPVSSPALPAATLWLCRSVGDSPSGGNPALLPGLFGGVQWGLR